jgi:hypothetical protein
MGHTLGMEHAETGVMTETSCHIGRNESVTQENINQMIEQGTGPVEHRISFFDKVKIIVNESKIRKCLKNKALLLPGGLYR